jgi:type I restriction enzyme M protein
LEGLDVTVLKLNEVRRENPVFRFDPQFFAREAIEIERTLKSRSWETLGAASKRIESFGAYALTNQFSYMDSGVPFLRCVNIKDGFVDLARSLFISPEAHKLLSKSAVEPEMVLLTMSGSVGEAAVALSTWPYPINSNQDVAKITTRDGVSPYFLVAFLNSRYGRTQAARLPVGSVQQHIFLWMLEQLVAVRRFSNDLESAIASTVKNAYEQSEQAKHFLSGVEDILTAALGLRDWRPPQPLTYTQRASEVFGTERLDAEHFQPKYNASIDEAKNRGARIVTLGSLVEPFIAGVDSRDFVEHGAPYIRVADVRGGRIEIATAARVPITVAETRKDIGLRADDVVFTRKGSFGNAAMVRTGQEDCVISTEIIRLRIRVEWRSKLLPEYLVAYFNSWLGKWEAEKWAHGAAFYSVSQGDLSKFAVPIAPFDTQQRIKVAFNESEAAHHRAHDLLAAAHRAVEIAIEKDESAALKDLEIHS